VSDFRKIFRVFWGSPWDLESVKISEIYRRNFEGGGGEEKHLTPPISPPGGLGAPKFFPLGGLPSLYFAAKFHAPKWKTGVRGAWQLFSFFSIGHFVNRVFRGACTTIENFLYCFLQRTKLSKKYFVRILNFAPVLVIWPPKLDPFWEKKLAQIFRAQALQGYRVRYSQVQNLVAKWGLIISLTTLGE